jgi:hypothetical protein
LFSLHQYILGSFQNKNRFFIRRNIFSSFDIFIFFKFFSFFFVNKNTSIFYSFVFFLIQNKKKQSVEEQNMDNTNQLRPQGRILTRPPIVDTKGRFLKDESFTPRITVSFEDNEKKILKVRLDDDKHPEIWFVFVVPLEGDKETLFTKEQMSKLRNITSELIKNTTFESNSGEEETFMSNIASNIKVEGRMIVDDKFKLFRPVLTNLGYYDDNRIVKFQCSNNPEFWLQFSVDRKCF